MHKPRILSLEQIKRILFQLKSVDLKAITWAGGGEPLESPYWYYAFLAAQSLGFKQALYTYMPEPSQAKVETLDHLMEFIYSHPFNTKEFSRPNRRAIWTVGFLLDSENWNRITKMVDSVDLNFFDFVDFRPLCPTNELNPKPLDYKWVPDALELLQEFYGSNPQVKWAEYKFLDLLKADCGRGYESCLSTDFTTLIGSDGSVYECLNRRGFSDSVLGNILTEDLAEIWKRKKRSRENFTGCRMLCRNHEINKELYQILGPPPKHEAFV